MTSEDAVSEESGRTRVIAGRYALQSQLGEGGMGTVWRAHDEVLHREVAIKEVRPPVGLATSAIERMYTRLEREAWAAARVSHRNVVTIYDVAMEEGRPWIVMELVRGQSLADLLKAEGTLTARRAASIGGEVLAALLAAHEAGVLHRDVKPANVLMAKDGRVVLTDFGIAVVEGSTALTMTGEVVGSPEFLAPERALGKRPGLASDLWSLGVLLYAAVEGSSPFRQNTPLSTLRAIVDTELPPVRRAGALTPVIEGLLRKDPDERLGAEQAVRDLRLVSEGGTLDSATGPQADSPTVVAEPETQPAAEEPPTRVDPRLTIQAPATRAETHLAAQPAPDRADTHVSAESASAEDRTQPAAQPASDDAETHIATQLPPGGDETRDATLASAAPTGTQRTAQVSPAQAGAQAAAGSSPTGPTGAAAPARPAASGPEAQPTVTHVPAQPAGTQPVPAQTPPAQPVPAHPAAQEPTVTGTPAVAPTRRNRRTTVLVAAGAALCALALAGTGYALMGGGDDDAKKGNAAAPTTGTASASPGAGDAEEAAAPGTGDDGQDAAVSEGVRMKVTGSHTTYSGQCPPPNGQAPTFTATFTVERLPAQFSYRWVSTDGSVTDEEWRTLSFPNGGSLTKQVTISLTTWAKAGTFRSGIGVELNAPLKGRSNTVPLSLTCDPGAADGTSSGQ
ncbi:protein kinase domain-containing protein [Streptomyces fructofermentans]|uniref:protein kinase domain-containing protein n=1 Tax=Streptomyces fructofermentans TaxID=152141 RepID=UPI00378DA37D